MDKILIKGGNRLSGEVEISGAKNATLPLLAASLLTEESVTISNIPALTDIVTMLDLLSYLGVDIEINETPYYHDTNSSLSRNKDAILTQLASSKIITAKASNINKLEAPYDIVRKMRASIWVLGPLLARFGKARVSLPGGCAIGVRQIDMHIDVLKSMGASIDLIDGYINATINSRLTSTSFNFSKVSVGATITAILAASLAEGTSHFTNCAREPEIADLCDCLIKMGAQIHGAGTSTIEVSGVKELRTAAHRVISDRIEAGTYMIAAAITKGNLTIKNIKYYTVESLYLELQKIGVNCTHDQNSIYVETNGVINSTDIATQPFPGFPTDLQAQFMALMSLANGTSIIVENIFENRFMHVLELNRLGANITTQGNSAIIRGVQSLKGAPVMATDLRASVALILAGLAAEGETIVGRVYHLDRGYENLEQKLRACGAIIERIKT